MNNPMTPEEAAAWDKRKNEQYARMIEDQGAAMAAAGLTLSMTQTGRTFTVNVSGPGDFRDEMVIGDPAKTVPRDDRLFKLRAIDLSDNQIRAAFTEWRLLRKLPPPSSRLI